MPSDREVMQQARQALVFSVPHRCVEIAIAALDAQLAAPAVQPEPVAWLDEFGNVFPLAAWKPAQATYHDDHKRGWRPLYATPPPAPIALEEPLPMITEKELARAINYLSYETQAGISDWAMAGAIFDVTAQLSGTGTTPALQAAPTDRERRLRDALEAVLKWCIDENQLTDSPTVQAAVAILKETEQ